MSAEVILTGGGGGDQYPVNRGQLVVSRQVHLIFNTQDERDVSYLYKYTVEKRERKKFAFDSSIEPSLYMHTFFTMEGGDSEFANFTLPTLKAFLEARSHNVSGNKQ